MRVITRQSKRSESALRPAAAAGPGSRTNRGPAAAAGNRQAILRSARRLFAEQGFLVPLTAIAREAGVGQGVLYRHFPTRMALALAVFDENLTRVEQVAARAATPDGRSAGAAGAPSEAASTAAEPAGAADLADGTPSASPFEAVWRELLDLTLSNAAFIETAAESARHPGSEQAADRLTALIAPLLADAQQTGGADAGLAVPDLFLALRASYGVTATAPDAAAARRDVATLMRALRLPEPVEASSFPRP